MRKEYTMIKFHRRTEASERVEREFDLNLNQMGYSGNVEFMHKDKTLKLNVQIDSMNEKTRAQDVRCISGGERSYVSLCFLLALGAVVSI